MRRLLLLSALLALGTGCATTGTYVAPEARDQPAPPLPDGEVAHTVYLTGNTADLDTEAVLRALAADATAKGEDATVVLLGDVTEAGLPPAGDPDRAEAERPLRAVIDALSGIEGEVIAVPGDRDWARGEDGLKRIEDVLDEAFDADVLTPGDQAGGPREWEPAEALRLVAIDTGWWLLDPSERPEGEAEDQDVRTPGDVARILEQVILDRDDDRIIVLAHHPLISRGPYAGYRSNPLSSVAARTFGLGRQDLASTAYRQMRDVLGRVVGIHDRLVYAAGHDPILQSYNDVINTLREQTHLVSGTGGGVTAAAGAGGADYVSSQPGYQRLVYYADGRLWSETVEVDAASGAAEVVFRTEIAGANAELVDPEVPERVRPDYLPETIGETVTLAADADYTSPRFKNDGFTRAFFGRQYRDVWKVEVEFPVLNMGTEAGGLTPVKRGGGLQTTSLRLDAGDGHQYGLRLLEKSGLAQVPYELRDGLVGDIVLELRAAMNPYGALVASPLARAAGIAQPDPKIVFIPDDPRLGRYRETFANRLALYEIRPDDDMSEVPGFEGMYDVGSAANLREELREDQDHRVDQRAYLRARLFDMLLGDWDRHADQWRWAAFEPGELDPTLTGEATTQGKVYVPIARDRDFSFYGIGGLFQPVLNVFDNRLQPYDDDFDSIVGLTHNGFYQDRRFLNQLTREDWAAVAADLQTRLGGNAFPEAVRNLPAPVRGLLADEWGRIWTARLSMLPDVADRYYAIQAGTVDVLGSDEREAFDITRMPDGRLEVVIRSFKGGEDGRELYRRTFLPDETDEVRLYGMAARDVFRVTGDGPASIDVRIIAGAGNDELEAPAGRVAVYDTPDGLVIVDGGPGIEDRRSDDPDVNRYDPTEQVLGDVSTFPVVGYQATDGAILGLSRTWFVPGFRLRPFAATHTVAVNYATATGGFAGSYTGRMREAIGAFDLDVDALASAPRYARNFYGLGNGSPFLEDGLEQIDLGRAQLRAGLGTPIGEGVRLVVGPLVRYADASRDSTQLFLPPDPPTSSFLPRSPIGLLPEAAFDGQTHAGGFARLELSTADRPVNPRQGIRLGAEGSVRAGLTGPAETYGTVGGELVTYLPIGIAPQVTLALRAGADHIFGEFPFFDAAVLGGPGTLRGYRRERFAGRTAASGSAELRLKLFNLNAYVLPLEVGALGFADAGRVWADVPSCGDLVTPSCQDGVAVDATDPDNGDGAQLGYGGGLWIGVLDRGVVNLTVGASDESTLVTLGLGFSY